MKIAFDVGGVLSKYPHIFRQLLEALRASEVIDVCVISDMYPVIKIIDVLIRNDLYRLVNGIYSADYATHGENCKAVLCKELGIDIYIDDFVGYLVTEGAPVRLLVMPNPGEDYYHETWKTDGSEGNFGRRRNPMKNPEQVQP